MVTNSALWECPKCGRKFPKKNQWHSCISYSMEHHFRGKPAWLREPFDFLLEKMGEFGPIRLDAVKSSISIAAKSHFAGMHVLGSSLNLGFILDTPLEDERILRTQKLSETRWGHTVKLAQKEDADAQVLAWLKRAHSLRR